MRHGFISVAVAAAVLLMSSHHVCADIPDPGAPSYTNKIFTGFVTPVIKPGEVAVVSFNVSNPYDDPAGTMMNTTLTVGIYWYATTDEDEPVTDEFPNPPSINGNGTTEVVFLGRLARNESKSVSLAIETTKRTPHGSYFSQSTYFLRLKMTFSFEGNTTIVVLQSRGWFTEEQWSNLVSFETGQPLVDVEYMRTLGVDGLLPDSAFGIKAPIPRWPLGVLIGLGVALGLWALYYFVMDNPGKYPALEKRFYHLRGKLGESWRQLKHRRGK